MIAPFEALLGPSYTMISPKAEIQKSVNIYRQRIESGQGAGQFLLMKSPGLKAIFQPLGGPGQFRGGIEVNGAVAVAIGNQITTMTVFNAVFFTYPGTIADDGLPVRFASSATGNSFLFCSGGILYRANGATLTAIALPGFPAAAICVDIIYIGSYYVAISNKTTFAFSVDDGVTFAAANIQLAQASNNNFVGAINHQEILFIFGNRVMQSFVVGTNANAPFVAQTSGTVPFGAETVGSIQSIGTFKYFLGRAKEGEYVVYKSRGYDVQRISNFALDNVIRTAATKFGIADAFAQVYRLNGQEYYRLIFPAADISWELNCTVSEVTGIPEWEELQWHQLGSATPHRHKAGILLSCFGSLYAGDNANGWWYEFTPDEYTDFGFPLSWLRRAPQIVQGALTISFDRLELIIETGVGLDPPLWLHSYNMNRATFVALLATEVGNGHITALQSATLQSIYDVQPYIPLNPYPSESEMISTLGFVPWGNVVTVSNVNYGGIPQIGLQYSNNTAKSFTPVMYRSLGQKGTDLKVYWDRLGSSAARVFQLTGDGPNKLAIVTAFLDSEVTLR